MPTSQSQAQKVYAEVVTDNGGAVTSRVQKVYAEVISDSGIIAKAQVQKVYAEVIGDPPASTSITQPIVMACT